MPCACCSQRVVSAYRECADLAAREAAKAEIQALTDAGLLKPVTTLQQNNKQKPGTTLQNKKKQRQG